MNSLTLHVPTLLVAVAFFFVIVLHAADAKRGCTTFGHSCYGGMGKRGLTDEVPLEIGQNEENPALVFTGPRSEFRPRYEQFRLTPLQLYNLSPFIRRWLRTLNQIEEQQRLSYGN